MPGPHRIDRGIVARHVDGDRVDVGRDAFRTRPKRERREGEQTGSRSNVGDVGESLAGHGKPVECIEAARCGRMLASAERETRIDLEIDRVGGPVGVVHRRMDEEAAGTDRLKALLAPGHPIG